MAINKTEIYNQIDAFNSSPSIAGGKSNTKAQAYLYVTKDFAEDRAAFLKYILSNDAIFKSKKAKDISVLDMAFGSGNLTSHLLLDNDIEYSKIIFNDKNSDRVNSNIVDLYEKKAILKNEDFFKSENFNEVKDVDFVVFNPQVGGTGDDFKIKTGTIPVISTLNLENYLLDNIQSGVFDTKGFVITIDEDKKNITIASEVYTRKKLEDTIGLEIFNYYDVNYKGKTGDATTNVTDIAKFRKTFDNVFNKNGILAYYGDESNFKILFADFNYVLNYWASPKNFILASKEKESSNKCFERSEVGFVEIPGCIKQKDNSTSDEDLDNLEEAISEELIKLNLSDDNESPITKPDSFKETEPLINCDDISSFIKDKPRNKIYYGAPGTGKSFKLRDDVLNKLNFPQSNTKRVTFHPSYSYQQFVGSYKPTPIYKSLLNDQENLYKSDRISELTGNEKLEPLIDYSFVPGPFLELLIEALLAKKNNTNCNFMLIIEEINRANVASVFGDVFQLLDRKEDGSSEYPIVFNTDIRNYLRSKGITDDDIRLPSNFFIWATMNNADQGVLPLDSAFKRRWSFEYISINAAEGELNGRPIKFQNKCYEWNSVRRKINFLLKGKVNEDKMLGPFYMNGIELLNSEAVKNKLLLYLREDVLRHNPEYLFSSDLNTFSEISEAYDEKPSRDIFAKFDWTTITTSDKCLLDYENEEIEENEDLLNEKIIKGRSRTARSIDEQFDGRSSESREFFDKLKNSIESFGEEVTSYTNAYEILFKDSTNFVGIYVYKNGDLKLNLRIIDNTIDDPKGLTSDIPESYGWGKISKTFKIELKELDNKYTFDEILHLIRQAYNSKK
jgi:predicted transport protein